MRTCLWKLYMRHFSICFFTVVGLQFWTLSCKFPSHSSWYFFSENIQIKFVFSVYFIFGMLLVPGVGCLLSPFSPVGFFSGHRPLGRGGRCNFFVLAPPTPGCGLSVNNRPPQSDTCSHLFVFFPGWRVKTNILPYHSHGWKVPATTMCSSLTEWLDSKGKCPVRMNIEQPCILFNITEKIQETCEKRDIFNHDSTQPPWRSG